MSRTIIPQGDDNSKQFVGKNIERVPKDKAHPYTVISNSIIGIPEMSLKASGILLYALSKPDYWELREKDLVEHYKDGTSSIREGLKELCRLGFLHKIKSRSEKGTFDNVYYRVSEYPIIPVESISEPVVAREPDTCHLATQAPDINHGRFSTMDTPPYSNYLKTQESTNLLLKNRFFAKPLAVTESFKTLSWANDPALDHIDKLSMALPFWLESIGCSPDHHIGDEGSVGVLISLVNQIVPDKDITCLSIHNIVLMVGLLDLTNKERGKNPYKHMSTRFLLQPKVLAHAIALANEYNKENPYQTEWDLSRT